MKIKNKKSTKEERLKLKCRTYFIKGIFFWHFFTTYLKKTHLTINCTDNSRQYIRIMIKKI